MWARASSQSKAFPDSAVDDLSHHIIPIIRKQPTYMIIDIGTNDSPNSTSREIQDNLLNLKSLINAKLPQCKVCLSTTTLRTDTLTVSQ